jgi:hypothetical protein
MRGLRMAMLTLSARLAAALTGIAITRERIPPILILIPIQTAATVRGEMDDELIVTIITRVIQATTRISKLE